MRATKPGRVGEADLRRDVIAVLNGQPRKEITTSKLIKELRNRIKLTPEDEEQLAGRNDDRFSQIVRNIKSHKSSPGNMIYDGVLEAIPRGFRLREAYWT
jgi:hypothetical protein